MKSRIEKERNEIQKIRKKNTDRRLEEKKKEKKRRGEESQPE